MLAKQSTVLTVVIGPILDSTGAEYASAVIGDLSISKNGGTLTAMASAATLTYIANGLYTLVTTAGNMDTLGAVQVTCNKATYQMPKMERNIVPATVYDALITNATNTTGGLPTATGAISALAGAVSTLTIAQIDGSTILAKDATVAKDSTVAKDATVAKDSTVAKDATVAKEATLVNRPTLVQIEGSTVLAKEATVNTRASQASVDTLASYVDTEVAAIKAKTDNLPTDPADASDIAASFVTVNNTLATIAGYIDTEVAAIKAKTDNLPSDPADASDIAASFASVNAALTTITGYIDTEVAAIKAKTDNLPVDPADASDIAASFSNITTLLNTLASYVDTEVAAIKAKTDNLPASPAAVSDIPTANQNRDAVWNAILTGATYNITSSAGRRLRQLASVIVRAGTAQGAGTGSNQIQLDAGASAISGDYDPGLIFIETGTGAGQARLILQYNGSTRVATVDRDWRVNPDNTSEFVILADAGRNSVNEGLAQSGTSTTITLNANASSTDDAYNGQLVFIRSGTGQDQVGLVEDYVGSTKVATIKTRSATGQWSIVPDATSAYMMIPNLTYTVSEIQSGLATSSALSAVATNVTALVTRIPATLFAGVTSLANWLGAIAGKTADSTTRSQINLTPAGASFNETTDSLEAIRDRGDAAWITGGNQGTGARIVTITVRDSSASPVEAATVRVSRAGETYAGVTHASGVTSFSLDDATFTVAITAAGFSFTPVSLVVSGNVSQTYTLTSTGGVTPSVTPRTTGFWTVNDLNGVAQAGAQVTIQASSPPPGSTGLAMEDAPRTATADNQGVVQFNNLVKGATYIVYRTGSSRKYNIVVPSAAGDSVALGSIVG